MGKIVDVGPGKKVELEWLLVMYLPILRNAGSAIWQKSIILRGREAI